MSKVRSINTEADSAVLPAILTAKAGRTTNNASFTQMFQTVLDEHKDRTPGLRKLS